MKQKPPPVTVKPLTVINIGVPGYAPGALLDGLLSKLGLKNDAALARALHIQPPVVSKIRCYKAEVSPAILVRMHDVTKLPISELRAMMGVRPVVI